MAARQPTERVVEWLEGTQLSLPGSTSSHASSEERFKVSQTASHLSNSSKDHSNSYDASVEDLSRDSSRPESRAPSSSANNSAADRNASQSSLDHTLENVTPPASHPSSSTISGTRSNQNSHQDSLSYDSLVSGSEERSQYFQATSLIQSSSNDSFVSDERLHEEPSQNSSLPESHATSSAASHPSGNRSASQESLDILENATISDSRPSSHTISGSGTDQNESRESSNPTLTAEEPVTPSVLSDREPSIRSGQTSIQAQRHSVRRPGARQPYKKTIENAASVFDHIKHGNICKKPRHDHTSLVCYDYFKSSTPRLCQEINDAREIQFLGNPPTGAYQRVLLVEDLSESTINALGKAFCINPEFFEEHLLNSGYASAEYDMMPAKMWATASLEKSHASAKWIRPVYRLPMYSWNYKMQDLAKTGKMRPQASPEGEKEDESNQARPDSIEHFTRFGIVKTWVSTNIFRSESYLWTTRENSKSKKRECGLEERISIWKGRLPGRDCEIVIMLVDPLPAIEEQYPSAHPKEVDWGVPEKDTDLGKSEVDTDSESFESVHVSEREFTINFYETEAPRRANEPVLIQLGRSLKALIDKKDLKAKYSIYAQGKPEQPPLRKVIVKQISPRNTVTVDLDQVFQSEESTKSLESEMGSASTLDGLREEIEKFDRPIHLGSVLFRIIKQDTLTLLRQLNHHGLDEREISRLDEATMEGRLSLWIQAISSAQSELSELGTSLQSFVVFCTDLDSSGTSESSTVTESEVMWEFQELMKTIALMTDRLQRISTLLTSNMSLLESRRSINEAQAVSRLTELAFVFVPLSFASSIFGMQVTPFADPVPLRTFFIVAVGVTMFAYLMRLTMRSQWLAYLKAGMRQDVREYAESHGLPPPTHSISIFLAVQWLWSCFSSVIRKPVRPLRKAWRKTWATFGFSILFILLNGSVAALPIGILWAQDLDPGIQCAVSITISIIVFWSVGVPFFCRSDPTFRIALLELIISGTRRCIPRSLRTNPPAILLLGIVVAVTTASLVLIWIRPLALGIKSGLTVGIVLSMIVIFCGILVHSMRSKVSSAYY